MSIETQAASSPAEVDVFQGESPSLAEYNTYRKTGEVPARFKPAEPADSAPADAPEKPAKPEGDKPETAPDSDPDDTQEQIKGSGAEKRIKQLLAKNKELERKLQESAPKPDVTASSPAPVQAAQQFTRPKPTLQDKNPDGSDRFKTYEEHVEALVDWGAEQRVARYQQEQMQHAELGALKVKLDEARSRYDDADSVIFPAAQTIKDAQIPQAVKQVFADSDLFVDLCYVVGSDPDELKSFVRLAQTNPRAALAKVFEYERGIREELAKGASPAPEKKQTAAPKPPSPVSGGSSRAFDVSDESLSNEEWARQRNKQVQRRGKG